jgi:hypothetical protein
MESLSEAEPASPELGNLPNRDIYEAHPWSIIQIQQKRSGDMLHRTDEVWNFDDRSQDLPSSSCQTPECGAERDARCTGRPEVREATRVEKQLCLVGRLQPAARRAPMGLRAAFFMDNNTGTMICRYTWHMTALLSKFFFFSLLFRPTFFSLAASRRDIPFELRVTGLLTLALELAALTLFVASLVYLNPTTSNNKQQQGSVPGRLNVALRRWPELLCFGR